MSDNKKKQKAEERQATFGMSLLVLVMAVIGRSWMSMGDYYGLGVICPRIHASNWLRIRAGIFFPGFGRQLLNSPTP